MKDVVVIGGGPAGATAAGLLAREGLDVLVLEREVFPRFHIGESLLPCDLAVFRRLGIDMQEERFLYKAGAEFLDERVDGHTTYLFADALPGTPDHAYQVERATFDHLLLRRAAALGAEVHEDERVSGVQMRDDRGVVTTLRGTYEARYVIDATGQDAFLGRRDRTAHSLVDFGLAAVFTHFEALDPVIDDELCVGARGTIKVLFVDDGWCWAIPLGRGRISIGLVSRRKGAVHAWLDEAIAGSRFLSRVTNGARRARKPGMLASFSFHNERQHGARWACAGDAACFLDPVFSSGVSLGMVGAMHLVDTLVPAMRERREADPTLMDAHALHVGHAYDVFATLINSFYHTSLLHGLFFSRAEDQDRGLRQGLTSVLAGDVWRDDNPFQQKLMSSKRRRIQLVPHLEGAATPPLLHRG